MMCQLAPGFTDGNLAPKFCAYYDPQDRMLIKMVFVLFDTDTAMAHVPVLKVP
jgi:hypothetical protein